MAHRRRDFLKQSAALAAMAAAPGVLIGSRSARAARAALVKKALANNEREIIMAGGGGSYGKAAKKFFYDPFTKETGIVIRPVSVPYGQKITKLKAMVEIDKVEWDIVSSPVDVLTPDVRKFFLDLGDCSGLPNVRAQGIEGTCLRHAILFDVGGIPLVYDTRAFPAGKRQPRNWADFWNVKDFPGPRALPNAGVPWWPLMAALQADGVPSNKLFPLDLDRGFKKLSELKPNVGVWWKSGNQSQQIIRNREVVMSMMYSGRALKLKNEGVPVNVIWNGAPIDAAFWGVTKKAKHPNAALAFLNFVMTRPEAHAGYARTLFYDTSNKNAIKLLSAAERKTRAVHPDNWSKMVPVDRQWVAANRTKVKERWLKWVAS